MLKSIFIVAYLTVATVVSINSIQHIISGNEFYSYLGVLFTSAPIVLFVMRIMILKDKARTSNNLNIVLLLAVFGVGLTLFNGVLKGDDIELLYIATGMTALFLLYDHWYSKLDRSSSKLAVGEALPPFELRTTDGEAVTSERLSSGAKIFVFYRGNWCPLCVAQVKEMVAGYAGIKEAGATVAFISPQPQKYSRSLAKKFGVEGIEFYQDEGNAAARALGIFSAYGTPMGMQAMGYDSDTVMPTVIITDREGKVLWTHETDNYRVRPEPETYIEVLKEHGIAPV
ncbi:peroxiredoxin family protein [Kordiimonas laminariae]|uniref:peroxiredoxin family protein n=1 Tax=Kordiimonas laminariae TaxID=2917717 RepID=UPI001FF409F9|nr:redoxin family protein [Kordiimonas laminariae]